MDRYFALAISLAIAVSVPPWRGTGGAFAQTPAARTSLSIPVQKLLRNAETQTRLTTIYDPSYVSLRYPGGDVPIERGVCSDVIVRALRASGVDLQRAVHEDMASHFADYPRKWGLRRPDPNIDHRRVPNLRTYLRRRGKSLPITTRAADYRPGDFVTWELPNGRDHIGLVSDIPTDRGSYGMIHNIGEGARCEDVLFAWKITGHYRYYPR